MNTLDFIILLPIAYFAWRGFMNGFIKEILSIAGIVIAVFLTFEYMADVSRMFRPIFSNGSQATIAAGIFIFVLTVAMAQFIAYAAGKFLELININFINKLVGLIFGSLKSGIIVSAFLLLLAGFNLPGETARNESISYPYVIYLAPAVFDLASAVYPGAENFIETIEKTLEENNPIRNLPLFEDSDS
ncbi:CvpA family protein [Rhodohalobacter mucosus]|uniref:CvpA family protein n=1 Tax=Rhodohalobacter mucosus TaxID=2079485 RepID=A0A316TRN2_9BACT|nr:CvpA family protein [Rhodohalobacter mucosus]PWN05969.1 CvpA family protein [Rhodohalobacter mucosus]